MASNSFKCTSTGSPSRESHYHLEDHNQDQDWSRQPKGDRCSRLKDDSIVNQRLRPGLGSWAAGSQVEGPEQHLHLARCSAFKAITVPSVRKPNPPTCPRYSLLPQQDCLIVYGPIC